MATTQAEAFTPSAAQPAEIGALAARPHLQLITPEAPLQQINSQGAALLGLVSQGYTWNQASRRLDASTYNVRSTKHQIMEAFGTTNMSVIVDRSIRSGLIPVAPDDDPSAVTSRLSLTDVKVLRFLARGGSTKQLRENSNLPPKRLETYHSQLLEKLGAWSRPHAIRRGHELGIL